jgi:hypothetical protein
MPHLELMADLDATLAQVGHQPLYLVLRCFGEELRGQVLTRPLLTRPLAPQERSQ